MTREEISKKVQDLALQIRELGNTCNEQHYEETDSRLRATLYLLSQSLLRESFMMDSFNIYIEYD